MGRTGAGTHPTKGGRGDHGQPGHAQNPGNRRCHRSSRCPSAVSAALFTRLQPIENMWSKIKQILRSQAPRAESELLLATKAAFQAISAADCKGFFFNAKYAT